MRSQATAADTENHHHRYQFRLHPAATASSSSSSALTSMPVSVTTNGTVAITMQKQQQQQSSKMDDNQQQQQQPQQQQQQNAINNNNNSNNNNGDSGSNSASANNSNANNNNNNSNNIHAEHVKMSSNNNNTNNNSSNIVGAPVKCAPAATTTTNVCLSASSAISNTINGSSGSGNGGGGGGGNSQTSVLLRKQFISASTDASNASNASFSSASVAGSIQDDMLSDQCSLTQAGLEEYNIRASSYYDQPVLFHHQKQSSYAQSEGYHSYVSSSDSSSATPFLDRLRQESEMLSRQSSHHWSQNDLSSVSSNSVAPSPTPLLLSSLTRDSANGAHLQQHASNNNNNNSSESTSSTETLKWLGSMSDVSEASHATGYSAISESVSSSQLIVHSSRVPTPKRHHSESVLYLHDEQHSPNAAPQPMSASQLSADERELSPTRTLLPSHRHSPSYPPMHTPSLTLHPYQQPTQQQQHQQQQRQQLLMPLAKADDLLNSSLSVAANTAVKGTPAGSEPQPQSQHKTSISVTITSTESLFTISPQTPAIASKPVAPSAADDEAPSSASASQVIIAADGSAHSPQSAQSTAHTAALAVSNTSPTSPASSNNSPTGLSGTHSYRSNHRLFPVSTYTEPVHSNTSQYVHHPKPQYSAGLQKPPALIAQQQLATVPPPTPNSGQSKYATSPAQAAQPSWQSVAELINDFERSNSDPQVQAQKYTYIDPSKTHRVSNPALKAFQKNAVQSYFERQQQQHQHSKEHSQQKIYQSLAAHQHQHQHHLHQQQQHQQQQQLARPHSYQATNALKDSQQQMLRSSLPNTYAVAYQPPPSQQPMRPLALPSMTSAQMSTSMNDSFLTAASSYSALPTKPPSPAPPPPPPRSRSLMPTTLLRRSSSASDYAEFRDQYTRASQEKLAAQSVKNISSSEKMSFNDCGMPPPPPPPRGRINPLPTRRTSSASEYAAAMREKALLQQAAALAHQQHHPHQHAPHARPHPHPYCIPSSAAAPPIDGSWVPERPPKNPNLRIPSPDLPPPPTAEVDTSLSDEPLPPPPPEILHRQPYYDSNGELAPKAPSPNRRNSFAGSSTRKAFFSRTSSASSETATSPSKVPPLIPKKPSNIELLQVTRPTGGFVPQPSKAHKLLLNGGMSHHHHHQQQKSSPPLPAVAVASSHAQNAKMTANRKRPHNPAAAMISVPPAIIENCNTKSPPTAAATATTRSSPPPPPLMPRCMPNTNQPANVVAVTVTATNNKSRCNSKASYLPRQSLEKLNNSDPDHGSYKLTLTSNEDLVAHTQPSSYDILAHNGKLPNNLPDVLPLGAKLQPQPASPTSSNPSPLRYGSNNNLNASAHSMQQQQLQQSSPYPMYPPAQHRYSTPTMNSYNSNNKSGHTPGYTRSQSFDVNHSHAHNPNSPTKFMSQSTIDLKRTHHLEPTMEETAAMLSESASLLSPAQSENNLSSPSKQHAPPATQSLSSVSSSDGGGSEGRIFRAELVNATLSTSPSSSAPAGKTIARKDSLRENIEKITQLQSKLMSAHLSESSLISGYGSKTALNAGTPTASTATTKSLAQTEPKATEPLDSKQEHLTSSGSGSNADFSTAADCNANTEHSVSSSSHNDSTSSAMNALLPEKPASPLPQLTNVSTAPTASSSANSPLNTAAPTADDLVASQITQLNASTDGLKLMQRSEIILRVHPSTTEVASQTDDDLSASECDDMTRLAEQHQHQHAKEGAQQRITLQPRQPHPIELDCDSMSQELASLLAPNDKLVPILAPSMLKSPTDYVGNLYNPNVPQRPAKRDVGTSTLLRMKSRNAHDAQKVTVELQHTEVEVLLSNGGEADSCDLLKRKVDELIKQLNRKIRILSEEQLALNEESSLNDELGNNLVSKLTDKLRPIEATKCRTYIDDVGHITSLLLSLSERLAKAENSLGTIEAPASGDHSAEKKSLELKRERLLEQLAEAKRLKEDIERRGSSVVNMLEKNLTADEFADFDYFINMKAKLIADSRDIADKIKCGEEQLNALSEALIQSDC